ncbi:MAG TPA: tetratricopeptide repeat protein [Patescibacteria group bacterium]|nr:tetratricopeptide repeat protein [Patescibacteria group bacterium]
MSASDRPAPPRTPRTRRSLVIRRLDHVGDAVGLAFLESPETNGDAVLARIREYLGDKLKLIKAEVSHDEITVEVESRGWTEEAARLVAAARDLYAKGVKRGALSMYRDALDLDPFNAEATLQLGLTLVEQHKFAEAFAVLKRTRELGVQGVELLNALGRCAAALGRAAAGIAYYEEALKIEPRNFVTRRALSALGHKSTPPAKESGAVRRGPD